MTRAQSQTDWYIDDDPTLWGPQDAWYHGRAGYGYGSNNFRYTYAIGGETNPDNDAEWNFGRRIGRQAVSVYVPRAQATATVEYRIETDTGDLIYAEIAQASASGWTALGTWDFNGARVTVRAFDNKAEQHWRRDGLAASSIGIDAIAMRCVERCTQPSVPTGVRFDSGRITWNAVAGAESYGVALCVQPLGCVNYLQIACCSYTPSDLRDVTHINVYAVNSAGHSEWSPNVPIPQTVQLPDAPTGLDFRSGRATWNPVDGADSYIVTLCENHGGARQCPRDEAASCCSYAITDPRIVEFLVRAVNSAGEGPRAGVFDIPARKPVAPTGVRVTSGRATWNSVSGADSYEVALCTSQGCVVHDGIRSQSFAISDLTATYIKVRAVNRAGRGDWSRNVNVEIALPSSVRNLEFRYLDPDTSAPANQPTRRFEITWDPPSGQAAVTGYVVTMSRPAVEHHAAWSRSYNHPSNSFRRRHTGQAGTAYTVTVAAKNQRGLGTRQTLSIQTSNATSAPSQPRNVDAAAHGTRKIRVTWSPPSNSGSSAIKHYVVRFSRPAIGNRPAWSGSATTTNTSHTSGNLLYGTTYTVTVTAVNRDNQASRSATDTATTAVRPPLDDTRFRAIVDRMRELVRISESFALEAIIQMGWAQDHALIASKAASAPEDKETYPPGTVLNNTRESEIAFGWARRAAHETTKYYDVVSNLADQATKELPSTSPQDKEHYRNTIENYLDRAEAARDTAESASRWADGYRLASAITCSEFIVGEAGRIFDEILPVLRILQFATIVGSWKSIAEYLVGQVEETINDYLPEIVLVQNPSYLKDRFVGLLKDELPPEIQAVIDPFNPPDPRDSYDGGVLTACYFEDGTRVRVPLCSDLGWFERNILGKFCRDEVVGLFTDLGVCLWHLSITARTSARIHARC